MRDLQHLLRNNRQNMVKVGVLVEDSQGNIPLPDDSDFETKNPDLVVRADLIPPHFPRPVALSVRDAYNRSNHHLNEGLVADAIDQLEAVYNECPAYLPAINNLGIALTRNGRSSFDAAYLRYSEVISRTRSALGSESHLDISQYFTCLERPPEHEELRWVAAQAHYNRADVLMRLDRINEALADLDSAAALGKGFAHFESNTRWSRAGILAGCGRSDEAVKLLTAERMAVPDRFALESEHWRREFPPLALLLAIASEE